MEVVVVVAEVVIMILVDVSSNVNGGSHGCFGNGI